MKLSRAAWTGCRALAVLLAVVVCRTVSGQIPTDEVASERVLTPREQIDQELAASRFSLGPIRLTPGLYIVDATYDNNVYGTQENPVGDFRMTIAAGAGLIVPVTPNVFIRSTILPAYTWYATLQERRFFGGQFGGSFITFANRLTVEGGGGYSRRDVIYSTENQQRVTENFSVVGLGAEYRLLTRLYVYGGGRVQWFQYTGPEAPQTGFSPSRTDRTTYLVRAELRYKWSENLAIAVGAEETTAEFANKPEQYDNRTSAIIGSVYFDRPKFFIHFSGGYRDGEPIHGSTIAPFAGFTGGGAASYSLFRWMDLNAFGSRTLHYGTSSPYYIITRYGGGIAFNIGWRLILRGFGVLGDDSYTTLTLLPDGQSVYRRDDVTEYGGGADILITHRFRVRFLARESRYNSNVPGNDRSYFRWTVSLGFGGNLLQ